METPIADSASPMFVAATAFHKTDLTLRMFLKSHMDSIAYSKCIAKLQELLEKHEALLPLVNSHRTAPGGSFVQQVQELLLCSLQRSQLSISHIRIISVFVHDGFLLLSHCLIHLQLALHGLV
jgi:hypothetical protein